MPPYTLTIFILGIIIGLIVDQSDMSGDTLFGGAVQVIDSKSPL